MHLVFGSAGGIVISSNGTDAEFQRAVLDLVRRLLSQEGMNRATVHVTAAEASASGAFAIVVDPLEATATPLTVHVEGIDRVVLFLGVGSRAELYPVHGRNVLEQLEEYLRAAINGAFEETVLYGRDGNVLRARGRIVLRGSPKRLYYNWLLPFPRLPWFEPRKDEKRYSPYSGER